MAKVERFEQLHCWQRARELTRAVYSLCREERFRRDFGLSDQIRRAAVSVMSNIAEGFERYNAAEFKHFLSIARGSCAEVRCQLYVAFDAGYLAQADLDRLTADAADLSRMIANLRTRTGAS